jgi:hypothetical protein
VLLGTAYTSAPGRRAARLAFVRSRSRVAAAISAYPFASRLALWLVPLAFIALAAVLPAARRPRAAAAAAAVALTLVAAPMAAQALPQTTTSTSATSCAR